MIKRSFVLDAEVANLSRTSTSQSIYSDTCLHPPFLSQNPITLIYLLPRTLFPQKKTRIFIRFSLLCSFLIKDSSADCITCFFFRRISLYKNSEDLGWEKHTNWISDGNWRCHCFYTVWPQWEGKSSSSVLKCEIYQLKQLLETEKPRNDEVPRWFTSGRLKKETGGGCRSDEFIFCFILKRLEKFVILDPSACIIGALMLKFSSKY